MGKTVEEKQPETLIETLVKKKTEVLLDALACTLAEEAAKKQENTLGDIQGKTLVDALADTLREEKGQRTE